MKAKALAIVLLLVGGMVIGAQEARFVELNGKVEKRTGSSGDWQAAAAGDLIEKDAVISTGIKSSAVISIGSSSVTVNALTMLTLEELFQKDGTEEVALYLRTGRVKADVTPPTGMKSEFTVRSPTTTASVRGTSFSFNGHRLNVHSGKVALANNSGQKVYVSTKQHSYADSGQGQRLATPFEAETAGMRPVFNDLDNTGSKKEKPQQQIPLVNINFDWL